MYINGRRIFNLIEWNKTVETFFVRVIDCDGTIIDEQKLPNGAVYTLPTPPTHDRLIFDEWACTQPIVNNTVTINNNNVLIGPRYRTISGYTEVDTYIEKANTYVYLMQYSGCEIDWGDGTVDYNALGHTYAEPGEYTVIFKQNTRTQTHTFYESWKYIKSIRVCNLSCWYRSILDCSGEIAFRLKWLSFDANSQITYDTQWYGGFKAPKLKVFIYPNGTDTIKETCMDIYSPECKNIIVPYTITTISTKVFSALHIRDIVLPCNLTTITKNATNYNSGLASGNKYIKKIIIPESFSGSLDGLIGSLPNLTDIVVNGSSIEELNFSLQNCPKFEKPLVVAEGQTTVPVVTGTGITSISLPSTVTSFSNNQFRECNNLTNVTIPNNINVSASVSNIFRECMSLESVTLSSGTSIVPTYAFYTCNRLKEVIIPEGVTKISTNAFYQCESLYKVKFPSTFTNIMNYAFYNCTFLTILDFRDSAQVVTLSSSNAIHWNYVTVIVPDALYDEWIATTNWANRADKIIKASEADVDD